MKTYFCRELNRNYLVITDWDVERNSYVLPMLEHNTIPGLLPLQVRHGSQGAMLYYGITSRQSIARVFDRSRVGFEPMEQLLNHIRETAEVLQQYLLDDSGLLLSPEEIYMEADSGKYSLVYVPGGHGEDRPLLPLAEFLLKHLKHDDSRAVALGYAFYQQAGIPGSSLKECLTDAFTLSREEKRREPPRRGNSIQRGQQLKTYAQKQQQGQQNNQKHLQPQADRQPQAGKQPQKRKQLQKEKQPLETKERSSDKMQRSKGKADTSTITTVLLLACALFFLVGIYGLIIWWFSFDLTQAGGLAFFMIALIWLAAMIKTGKKKKQDTWNWELPPDQEEEEYLDEMLAQMDREEKEQEKDREAEASEAETNKTRFLGSGWENVLLLKSTEPDFYGDLIIREKSVQIGKKGGGADLLLPSDAVSRLHARLEKTQDGWQVTDLNSMNGTYVNDLQLQPNETRLLQEGDRLRFADLTYRY